MTMAQSIGGDQIDVVKKRAASEAFFTECKQRRILLLNCLNNLNNRMI